MFRIEHIQNRLFHIFANEVIRKKNMTLKVRDKDRVNDFGSIMENPYRHTTTWVF